MLWLKKSFLKLVINNGTDRATAFHCPTFPLTYLPNIVFQRTRATKRLGVFNFRGAARGTERKR
jgi:hypothetical protein